ncbi:MAG: L,D-transpeptidase family protein [Fuerstiella sp.]
MEPFAYEKPKTKGSARLVVAGLAAASLAIWYFDFVPFLDQVPTGTVDSTQKTPSPDDFLALLEAEKRAEYDPAVTTAANDLPMDDILHAGQSTKTPDSVYDSILSDTDPIENSFPEFGGLSEPPPAPEGISTANGSASDKLTADEFFADQRPQTSAQHNGIVTAGYADTGESQIQRTHFSSSTESTAPSFNGNWNEPKSVVERSPSTNPPSVLTSETAQKLRSIDQLIKEKATLQAHAILSELYWNQPQVRPMIQDRIDGTAAEIYINSQRHFAEPYMVDFGETLEQIAAKHSVPWTYLGRLNKVTPKTLQAGQTLKVLKGPFGAVVDISKFELTVHAHGWYVRRYRIGTGKNQSTPVGNFTVKNKLENPQWYNPDGGVVEADDPSNPLGEYWLGLGDHIGIHGTIDPDSVGKAQSRGCVHMSDTDIAEVFNLLSVGSPVKIRP